MPAGAVDAVAFRERFKEPTAALLADAEAKLKEALCALASPLKRSDPRITNVEGFAHFGKDRHIPYQIGVLDVMAQDG